MLVRFVKWGEVMSGFKEYWNEHGDVYAMEIAENAWDYQQSKIDELTKQRDSFIKAYEIEMDKSVELQKRVDAALEITKQGIRKQGGDYYLEKLEQALKGGDK